MFTGEKMVCLCLALGKPLIRASSPSPGQLTLQERGFVSATDFEFVFSHFHVSGGISDQEAFCLGLKDAIICLVPLQSPDTGKENIE